MSQYLPVEPLSEDAWERIEGNVYRTLAADTARAHERQSRPAFWRMMWVGGPALATVALGSVLLFNVQPKPVATPASSEPVAVAEVTPAEPSEHSFVTNDEARQVHFRGAEVFIGAHSELVVFEPPGQGTLVSVVRGEAAFQVERQSVGSYFVVQGGSTRVRVVGTEFSVTRAGEGADVAVAEGAVEVTDNGETVLLGPGQHWSAQLRSHDLEKVESVKKHQERKRTRRSSVLSAREVYVRAATREDDDPDAAAALYRQVARGSGSWAANALYALALLELDRGHQSAGKNYLKRYLERFPDGENADDARRLLERY
jgi:ferric-dicitrate binding protein FerR (iron transport regulator)